MSDSYFDRKKMLPEWMLEPSNGMEYFSSDTECKCKPKHQMGYKHKCECKCKYKVKFQEVLPLVSKRKVMVWKGKAYLTESDFEGFLIEKFRINLRQSIEYAEPISESQSIVEDDDRVATLLDQILSDSYSDPIFNFVPDLSGRSIVLLSLFSSPLLPLLFLRGMW